MVNQTHCPHFYGGPACALTYAELAGAPYDIIQGVLIAVELALIVVAAFRLRACRLANPTGGHPNVLKSLLSLMLAFVIVQFVRDVVDPLGWRAYYPLWLHDLITSTRTAVGYGIVFVLVLLWFNVVDKVTQSQSRALVFLKRHHLSIPFFTTLPFIVSLLLGTTVHKVFYNLAYAILVFLTVLIMSLLSWTGVWLLRNLSNGTHTNVTYTRGQDGRVSATGKGAKSNPIKDAKVRVAITLVICVMIGLGGILPFQIERMLDPREEMTFTTSVPRDSFGFGVIAFDLILVWLLLLGIAAVLATTRIKASAAVHPGNLQDSRNANSRNALRTSGMTYNSLKRATRDSAKSSEFKLCASANVAVICGNEGSFLMSAASSIAPAGDAATDKAPSLGPLPPI